jgi:malate dehydrogenase (oxaloacetate-decarboxylating)
MNYDERSLELHKKFQGKIETTSKVPVESIEDLSLVYSPGVAAPSRAIADDTAKAYDYTLKGRTVAVVSDGSAVLGLGNVGPEAALPVMEGKAMLFKQLANIDAFPICLNTQDVDEIVATVQRIAPTFGGINLEDISAPRCFEIESRLQDLGIPVFHDDQHGTAIVALAGLINACKVTGKDFSDLKVVINGAGAAGIAIANLLSCHDSSGLCASVRELIVCDSRGIISVGRDNLNPVKEEIAQRTNRQNISGSLVDALVDADVFIGVSVGGVLTKEMVQGMKSEPIIFALANPTPEIFPEEAHEAGATVVATGRSDYPNQVNNVLVFPGIFKGALSARVAQITFAMKYAAANALAALVQDPRPEKILPEPLDPRAADAVAQAIQDVE